MKKMLMFVMSIVMLMTMSACTIQTSMGTMTINPTFEVGNSTSNRQDFVMELDSDSWQRLGITRGSSVKVKFTGSGATVTFDLRFDVTKITKNQAANVTTSFMKDLLGGTVVSSTETWSNTSQLKYTLYFRF